MKTMVLVLFLLPLLSLQASAAADAQAGKAAWDGKACRLCHGFEGQGGYGPDLAGRGISFEQFKQAVRKPWAVMPAFTERQVSDQMLADMHGYLSGLSRVAEPAAWRLPAPPADAPRGQFLLITNGCGQCHQPELRDPRMALGGEASEVNFELFAKLVYTHTDEYPDGRMGNFSRMRLPPEILQEIYKFAIDGLGLLPPVTAEVKAGAPAGANATYTLTLKNEGKKAKGGLTAEGLTISLNLAPGATVVSNTGSGYQGLRKDPKTNADVAVWQVPRIGPEEEQTYTLTLSGAKGAPAEVLKNSTVSWSKPEMRKGYPNLALRDGRMQGKDAQTPVTFPPPAQQR